MSPRRAILFLDRDGTLMEDVGYPRDPAQVRLLPGAADAVRELAAAGFVPVVVSNQSGIARGLITPDEARAVHDRFVALFESASGVRLPCYYCPHGPDDGCDCRKPKPGLYLEIAQRLDCALAGVPVIGDSARDLEPARTLGARPILVRTGKGERTLAAHAELARGEVYDDLAAAVDALLKE